MFKEPVDQFQPNTKLHLVKGIQVCQMMGHRLLQGEIIEKLYNIIYIVKFVKSSSEPQGYFQLILTPNILV